jgi:hypothetical protein
MFARHPQRGPDQGKLAHRAERLRHHLVRRPTPDVEVGPVFEAIEPGFDEVEPRRAPLADELGPLRENFSTWSGASVYRWVRTVAITRAPFGVDPIIVSAPGNRPPDWSRRSRG